MNKYTRGGGGGEEGREGGGEGGGGRRREPLTAAHALQRLLCALHALLGRGGGLAAAATIVREPATGAQHSTAQHSTVKHSRA
jgi:hypothetical protein